MTAPPRRAAYTLHILADLALPSHTFHALDWWPFTLYFDRLLTLLEQNPEISVILGVTQPIERYLTFRPERYETIETLVRAGRLHIGPFYARGDYVLPNPESHIRNLLIGTATAALFGQPVRNTAYGAFLPGGTGFPAQFPQLLRGFGIEAGLFERGAAAEHLEFGWIGADGSRLLMAQLTQPLMTFSEYPDWVAQDMQVLRDRLAAVSLSAHLPLLDVNQKVDLVPTPLDVAREKLPDMLINSTLPRYLETLRAVRDLPLTRGELRSPQQRAIHSGTVGAQGWIKRASQAAESALLRRAEPIAAVAELLGMAAGPHHVVRSAWQELLNVQQSLDGVIADRDRADAEQTFTRVSQFADAFAQDTLGTVGARLFPDAVNTGARIVYNPGQVARTEHLWMDDEGVSHIFAENIPPLGFALCAVNPEQPVPLPAHEFDLTIENDYLRATVDPAGPTLQLIDKVRNITYSRLITLISEGDQGDLFTFAPVGRGIQNRRDLHSEGLTSYRCEFYERLNYSVLLTLDPAPEMRPDPSKEALHPLRVDVALRLTKGVPRLDVKITMHNTLTGHRVRALFPPGFAAHTALYDGAFEVAERSVEDLPPISPPEGWAETPVATRPIHGFGAVFNPESPRNGLIIANLGVPEIEVLSDENEQSIIAVTVLRSVSTALNYDCPTRTEKPDPLGIDEPAGALIGPVTAELSLIPTAFEDRIAAFGQAWAFADGPLVIAPVTAPPKGRAITELNKPTGAGPLLTISDPRFRITAIKLPDDPSHGGIIVRGFNYTSDEFEVRLTPFRAFGVCDVVRLDETETGGRLAIAPDGTFAFYAAPARALTFWLHD